MKIPAPSPTGYRPSNLTEPGDPRQSWLHPTFVIPQDGLPSTPTTAVEHIEQLVCPGVFAGELQLDQLHLAPAHRRISGFDMLETRAQLRHRITPGAAERMRVEQSPRRGEFFGQFAGEQRVVRARLADDVRVGSVRVQGTEPPLEREPAAQPVLVDPRDRVREREMQRGHGVHLALRALGLEQQVTGEADRQQQQQHRKPKDLDGDALLKRHESTAPFLLRQTGGWALDRSDPISRYGAAAPTPRSSAIRCLMKHVPDPPPESYTVRRPDVKTYVQSIGINVDSEFSPASCGSSASKHTPRLQALYYPADLDKLCRNLSSEARTVIEETGTNMLYVVFGFLEFYEREDSEKQMLAPLLAVPVTLEKGAIDRDTWTYQYSITYSGEDVNENQTLREKLTQDFSLQLPEFDEEDEPGTYFTKIQQAIQKKKRWKVRYQLTLGFLSFAKLAIWDDLDPKKWSGLLKHPLLKEVFSGGSSKGASLVVARAVESSQFVL